MRYKKNIQAVNARITGAVQKHINNMLRRLERYVPEINWVDMYFRKEGKQPTANRTLRVRLGIPGTDVFASESGTRWRTILRQVEEKLERQLKRRKRTHAAF
jgi:ribosomal subunit interface protein